MKKNNIIVNKNEQKGAILVKEKIVNYQKAYNAIIDSLRDNDSVIGVTVFGSIVTGDIWEDSDIDLFVIVKDNTEGIYDIYGEENNIPIHLKLLSKEEFINLSKNNTGGSTIHRKFISSKLVISKDSDITDKFTYIKYYTDNDREKWNLVYLGKLLKGMNACKKYMHNGKGYSLFMASISAIDNFSRLYLNFNGYLVSKNSTSNLINLNDDCEILFNNIMKEASEDNIKSLLDYIEVFLNENITKCCNILLDYLCENQIWLSSQEIKKSEFFKAFNIEVEEILGELEKINIVEKNYRDYTSSSNQVIIREKVYKIKTK